MTLESKPANDSTLKQCCAKIYESDFARLLLGDSFHPGGLKLTERMGELLRLGPEHCVLDVASGTGASCTFLAERFGCDVVGLEFSRQNVEKARLLAADKGLASRVRFDQGDSERLPYPNASFDAVICECAFCTFPNKTDAAGEFARVLRPGGRVGLSDLTRGKELPKELESLVAWIACIADAQPVAVYAEYLRAAKLDVEEVECHDEALSELAHQIRIKLLSAEVLVGLKRVVLPGVEFTFAKQMAQSALTAIQQGQLGYAVVIAAKPGTLH